MFRMVWQGDNETTIDKYDGRALLDYLPTVPTTTSKLTELTSSDNDDPLYYERYRTLIQNEFLGSRFDYIYL